MPICGLSRNGVLEALDRLKGHEDSHQLKNFISRAVRDSILAKTSKSLWQSREEKVSKVLALQAKQRAKQSLGRWIIQPEVNVFTAIRDNIEPLFGTVREVAEEDKDSGKTSAYNATERVRSCLEAIEESIEARIVSTAATAAIAVDESGERIELDFSHDGEHGENLACLEACLSELEHLYRLQEKLTRVGRRGSSPSYRGDPMTGYFGGFLNVVAGGEAASSVFFGIDWAERTDHDDACQGEDGWQRGNPPSVDELVSTPGKVFVFCPAGSNMSVEEEFIVRAAKARLFEKCLVKERENLFEGRSTIRTRSSHIVAYVADEFQRFVTVGDEHGEQSFIDRCRSYGVCCVFATQSLSSLRYKLGRSVQADNSLNIVLSNIGTKAFFRTTDREAIEYLNLLLGIDLGSSKRGLTTLEVGACWLARANGSFSRRRMRLD